MGHGSARCLILVCVLHALLGCPPLTSSLNPLGDFERMDSALEDELNSVSDDTVLCNLQLNSEVTPSISTF